MEVYEARPLTEEDKAEADAMWEAMTGGNYSAKKKKRLGKNEKCEELSLITTPTFKAAARNGILNHEDLCKRIFIFPGAL